MATAKKAPAKKAAASKKAPAKATTTKKAAPAKATTKKAPAAAKKSAADVAKATKAAAERREAQRVENIRLGKDIAKRRGEGQKWEEITKDLRISQGKAQLLLMRFEAGTASESATPAKVKRDRDNGMMSWPAIAAKYGTTKAAIQKLYREAGGDPHASYIGKGGRYFEHENKVAGAKSANKAAPSKKATASSRKAAAKGAKALFTEDTDNDAVKAKVDGKVITWTMDERYGGGLSEPARVKAGSAKVGRNKAGVRMLQFNDGNKTRTVEVLKVVKVAAK